MGSCYGASDHKIVIGALLLCLIGSYFVEVVNAQISQTYKDCIAGCSDDCFKRSQSNICVLDQAHKDCLYGCSDK